MRTSRGLVYLMVCTILCDVHTARAELAHAVALTVRSPPGSDCVTSEGLRSQVEERVGAAALSDAASAARQVDVRIVPKGQGFAASIRAIDARGRTIGERSLYSGGATCGGLERPLVLVISTLLGIAPGDAVSPTSAEQDEWLQNPPAQKSVATRAEDEPPVPDHPSSPGASEPFHFAVAISGGAQTGLLPGVSPVVSIDLVARRSWFAFRVGAGGAPWAERDLGGGARATFQSWFGDADVCAMTSAGSSEEIGFCAGTRAGAIHAGTQGLFASSQNMKPFIELTLRASFEVSLFGNHALLLDLGGAVPVLPQTYVFIEGDGQPRVIHTVDLGLLGEVGWLWRFGS